MTSLPFVRYKTSLMASKINKIRNNVVISIKNSPFWPEIKREEKRCPVSDHFAKIVAGDGGILMNPFVFVWVKRFTLI